MQDRGQQKKPIPNCGNSRGGRHSERDACPGGPSRFGFVCLSMYLGCPLCRFRGAPVDFFSHFVVFSLCARIGDTVPDESAIPFQKMHVMLRRMTPSALAVRRAASRSAQLHTHRFQGSASGPRHNPFATFASAQKQLAVAVAAATTAATAAVTAAYSTGLAAAEAAPAIEVDHVTLSDGRVLAYRSMGDPDGVPIICLHGMSSCHLTWIPKSDSFASLAPGVRIIAVDRPGYGGSSNPPAWYASSRPVPSRPRSRCASDAAPSVVLRSRHAATATRTFVATWKRLRARSNFLISALQAIRPAGPTPSPRRRCCPSACLHARQSPRTHRTTTHAVPTSCACRIAWRPIKRVASTVGMRCKRLVSGARR